MVNELELDLWSDIWILIVTFSDLRSEKRVLLEFLFFFETFFIAPVSTYKEETAKIFKNPKLK
jgi:hypothetical protein